MTLRHGRAGTRRPDLSIIVVTHNEGDNLTATVTALRETSPRHTELIVVDDHSTDASIDDLRVAHPAVLVTRPPERLGPPSARNFGARLATGRILLWSDAHVRPSEGWVDAFVAQLDDPDTGAVGPAMAVMGNETSVGYGMQWKNANLEVEWLRRLGDQPYPVPILGGAFIALRREVFEATGGFDDGLILWGGGDVELSYRLWSLGLECRIVPTVQVAHLFRQRFPYAVDGMAVLHNLLRIAFVHFDLARVEIVVNALRTHPAFGRAMARLAESDAWTRRDELRARRRRDASWYFERFPMPELANQPRDAVAPASIAADANEPLAPSA